jgi:hypothetical protein
VISWACTGMLRVQNGCFWVRYGVVVGGIESVRAGHEAGLSLQREPAASAATVIPQLRSGHRHSPALAVTPHPTPFVPNAGERLGIARTRSRPRPESPPRSRRHLVPRPPERNDQGQRPGSSVRRLPDPAPLRARHYTAAEQARDPRLPAPQTHPSRPLSNPGTPHPHPRTPETHPSLPETHPRSPVAHPDTTRMRPGRTQLDHGRPTPWPSAMAPVPAGDHMMSKPRRGPGPRPVRASLVLLTTSGPIPEPEVARPLP